MEGFVLRRDMWLNRLLCSARMNPLPRYHNVDSNKSDTTVSQIRFGPSSSESCCSIFGEETVAAE